MMLKYDCANPNGARSFVILYLKDQGVKSFSGTGYGKTHNKIMSLRSAHPNNRLCILPYPGLDVDF